MCNSNIKTVIYWNVSVFGLLFTLWHYQYLRISDYIVSNSKVTSE